MMWEANVLIEFWPEALFRTVPPIELLRRSGYRAYKHIECSSVVFHEKEDAFANSTGEQSEVVEFLDQTKESQEENHETEEIEEMNVEKSDSSLGTQESSESNNPNIVFLSLRAFGFARRKKRLPLIQLNCWRRGNLRTAEISRHALGEGGRESPPSFGVDKSTLK
jgi:hypothetical protein